MGYGDESYVYEEKLGVVTRAVSPLQGTTTRVLYYVYCGTCFVAQVARNSLALLVIYICMQRACWMDIEVDTCGFLIVELMNFPIVLHHP